ncbi:MAG TPA: indole-3-glycerol-phosphate synthase [Holophaga sp.]|nr:indole-3-glycerol-phosphate synthase [Holophaga sp.]
MLKKVQIFKALDIEIKKQKGPAVVKDSHRGHHSLKEELSQTGISIIGEVAGGNPFRGQVRESYRPGTHAKSLVENGARAISVATDRFLYFGEDKHLPDARNAVKVPLLRRDFIFEEYQVEESKILGADAILLVAALLEPERLKALQSLAVSKGLDVVMEVFNEADLERALEAGAEIICAVGRDMDTWEPSYEKALALIKKVPTKKCLRMVEAGVSALPQIQELEALGVHGVILGDVLLDEFYPGKRLAQLLAGIEPVKKPVKSKPKPTAESATAPVASTPIPEGSAKPAPRLSTSHPARKGNKEFQMEHIQTPDETMASEAAPSSEAAAKKTAAKKPAAKKAAAKKPAAKKPAAKKPAAKKPAAKKPAAKKAAVKKVAAKKPAVKKAAPKKAAAKKPAVKKAAPKKVAAKKPAVKKAAPKKAAAKKPAVKKAAPKKVAAKKPAVKKAAPKKVAAKKPVAKKAAPKKVAAKKPTAKKAVKK